MHRRSLGLVLECTGVCDAVRCPCDTEMNASFSKV